MLRAMLAAVLRREVIAEEGLPPIAEALALDLAPFAPDLVLYIERGGRAIGLRVAEALGVPAEGIDLSYPLSRLLPRLPRAFRGLAWPVKELAYRASVPRLNRPLGRFAPDIKIALVDDSASTGRSIRAALRAIGEAGVRRAQVKVAVIRRGPGSRDVVDYCATSRPVLFRSADQGEDPGELGHA